MEIPPTAALALSVNLIKQILAGVNGRNKD